MYKLVTFIFLLKLKIMMKDNLFHVKSKIIMEFQNPGETKML
jgi:hypothetical protein